MRNLVDVVGLRDMLQTSEEAVPNGDFEMIYDRLAKSPNAAERVQAIEEAVRNYFSSLELPDQPTLYDKLILSLRPKDLIATFNWDPLLVQAYRRNVAARELPGMAFLHGNVGIGICLDHRVEGYVGTLCEQCRRPLTPTRLLYPVATKDYSSDPFIKSEWSRMRSVLEQAYFVTIFGYSAPKSDAAARSLIQDVWEANQRRTLTQIETIDIAQEPDIRGNWQEFLDGLHYAIFPTLDHSWLMRHPRRSCETLAAATLMNSPWPDRPMPIVKLLDELKSWIEPLLQEERDYRNNNVPFQVPRPM
jgi:hypothetical protein